MRSVNPGPRYAKARGPEAHAWKGGRIVMGPDQYVGIFMPEHTRANGEGYVREHILVAEKALGKPLPPLSVIHHIDEIQTNNDNRNLVICQDNAYHRLLHVRLRIVKAGGNSNLDRVCGLCHECLPKTNFWKLTTRSAGVGSYCINCNRIKNRQAYERRRSSVA